MRKEKNKKCSFSKYRNTNYRTTEIQITDIFFQEYRNTNYKNADILITDIRQLKLHKKLKKITGIHKYKNTDIQK